MAEYMFLLFDDESWYDEITPEKWESAMKIHGEFAEAVEAAGAKVLDGRALERPRPPPPSPATGTTWTPLPS